LNSDISTNDKSTEPYLNNETIAGKEKEKAYKQTKYVSNSMEQSNEENIKYNESNQNGQIEIISSNTDETLENNYIRNEELKEYLEENSNYNKYNGLIIIVFTIVIAFFIYYKL